MTDLNQTPPSYLMLHLFGLLLAMAAGFGVHHVYERNMLRGDATAASQWQLGLGLAGGALVIGLTILPLRRRMRKQTSGTFDTWMITHSWLGVIATIILLHHSYLRFPSDFTSLRDLLLLCLLISVLLGIVLIVLKQKNAKVSNEVPTRTSRMERRLLVYHRVFSVLTGILLVVHVLFDAVVR